MVRLRKNKRWSQEFGPVVKVGQLVKEMIQNDETKEELLSNLVFEGCWSCGDLVGVCGFNSVFERDAWDDFREVVKAA